MTDQEEPAWLVGITGKDARTLIESDDRLIRVVAGPGAGKTTCLKRRTRRLIEGEKVDPAKIFVGTFTRAIARELRAELGEETSVSTLHSLAYRLLRDNPGACQGMKLRFLLAYEEEALLYDVAPQVPSIPTQNDRHKELLRLQSARSEREDYADAAFSGSIRSWLQRHGGMLVGEVVYLATLGLESHDIEPGEYDHVVVDEYQDLTAAEQELVELIWSRNGSLVVMGDNNQSIYSFRFNHPSGIDEFSGRWEDEGGAVDLTFPDNRRCGSAILHVANLMMAEASNGSGPMNAASGRTGSVDLVHWPDVESEIDGLAAHINSRPNETFLVLVPRRFIGYRLKDKIGDGAQTAFHEEILQHQVAQERFACASALADPSDMVAIRSWLGLRGDRPEQAPRRNADAYASLPAGMSGPNLVQQIAQAQIDPTGSGQSHVRARAVALQNLIEGGLAGSLDAIDYAFDPALAGSEQDAEKRRWLEADLTMLRKAAHEVAEAMEEPSLAAVMQILRYRIATRAPLLPDEDEPRVQIMTLHSAKGLEGENVIIAGAADQFMPGLSTDAEDLDEQRRLLYVAVTRARDNLAVSWSRRIPYADAIANGIRMTDGMSTVNGVQLVHLTRSSLLPQALPGGTPGSAWLNPGP